MSGPVTAWIVANTAPIVVVLFAAVVGVVAYLAGDR